MKDNATYWVLTSYGDRVLTTLRAIPKDDDDEEDGDASEHLEAASQ